MKTDIRIETITKFLKTHKGTLENLMRYKVYEDGPMTVTEKGLMQSLYNTIVPNKNAKKIDSFDYPRKHQNIMNRDSK